EVIQRVRERLDEHAAATCNAIPALEVEARALRAEIDRLVEAVAAAGQSPALIQALSEREQRLADVHGRLRAQNAARDGIRMELKRLQVGARKRFRELQGALERNPEEARQVMSALLEGGQLTATPIETENGRRFLLEGTAVRNLLAREPVSNGVPNGI
ncbi:MAG TPA: hypothetical protein VER33_15315, partial [Polyangiaceae bacterium]|nr:hypothetical protein [Polyangiaceae bacterium]